MPTAFVDHPWGEAVDYAEHEFEPEYETQLEPQYDPLHDPLHDTEYERYSDDAGADAEADADAAFSPAFGVDPEAAERAAQRRAARRVAAQKSAAQKSAAQKSAAQKSAGRALGAQGLAAPRTAAQNATAPRAIAQSVVARTVTARSATAPSVTARSATAWSAEPSVQGAAVQRLQVRGPGSRGSMSTEPGLQEPGTEPGLTEPGLQEPGTGTGPQDGALRGSVSELQARIRHMQGTRLDTKSLPTHPAIAPLLPGGGLKQGAAYSVEQSVTLLMALLAGPSAAGSWCGVVGVPEFGVEAAERYGIDLDRLVLVPHPGDQWLGVTAAIADVLTVVVTRPPRQASDGSVARLAARLRQRGSTLIVLGTWPQTDAMLSISGSRWSGIGDGHGHLAAREVTVTVSTRAGGRPRSAQLWLPDRAAQFTSVAPREAASRITNGPEAQVEPLVEALPEELAG